MQTEFEARFQAAANSLGLDLARASYGSVDEVYLAVLDRDILGEDTLTFA
jgi:adenylate cyclase, class 2